MNAVFMMLILADALIVDAGDSNEVGQAGWHSETPLFTSTECLGGVSSRTIYA